MRAVMIDDFGGPEVMYLQSLPNPAAGPGELLVDVVAAGVNYMDIGTRSVPGSTWSPPGGIGVEGAGTVSAVGLGVTEFAIGDRVAWYFCYGSYADKIVVPAAAVVPVPDEIDSETAAAIMMNGLTANHLTTQAYPIGPGDTALIHAAAGGVGLTLTQLIKARGGSVIGLVSRPEKVATATDAGADTVLVSAGGGFEDEILRRTNGEGVGVVYDGAGGSTFASSLASLRYHGTLAYYGPFIGDVPTLRLTQLPKSVKVSYPTVQHHVRTRADLLARSAEVFGFVQRGQLRPRIGGRYALADASQAHRDIESRTTTGKLLLIP